MFKKKKNFSDRLRELFGLGIDKEEFFEGLEDLLLEADLGPRLTMEILEELRDDARAKKLKTQEELEAHLVEHISGHLKTVDLDAVAAAAPFACFLFLGVNGVGKTTSIAKLASRLKTRGLEGKLVLAAGDTFRAAACEQLVTHGSRLGVRTVSQGSGADSGAVIFDALESARARGERLVLADTAGRLHNKAHLVKELEKVDKIVRQKIGSDGIYKKILVIDSTTGQNGLQQAEVFHQAVGVDAVILSKYDSSARGGILVSICRQAGLPVAYLGTGESYDSLEAFEPAGFAARLLSREL